MILSFIWLIRLNYLPSSCSPNKFWMLTIRSTLMCLCLQTSMPTQSIVGKLIARAWSFFGMYLYSGICVSYSRVFAKIMNWEYVCCAMKYLKEFLSLPLCCCMYHDTLLLNVIIYIQVCLNYNLFLMLILCI